MTVKIRLNPFAHPRMFAFLDVVLVKIAQDGTKLVMIPIPVAITAIRTPTSVHKAAMMRIIVPAMVAMIATIPVKLGSRA